MCGKVWIHRALPIWLQYIIYIMQYDEALNMWPSAEKDKSEISENWQTLKPVREIEIN